MSLQIADRAMTDDDLAVLLFIATFAHANKRVPRFREIADVRGLTRQQAKQIIADAAETLPEFSANELREAMEAAQVDSPVIGAAFSACVRDGVIEPAGRYVQSTEATTRHKIAVWRSLRYGRGAA